MSPGAPSVGKDGRADRRQPPLRRRLLAGLLSFVLVVVGILLIAFGVSVAGVAVAQVVEEAKVSPAIVVPCLGFVVGLGVVVGGARFVTRVRPWVVRRLLGCEVPRIPAPIRAMATGDGGEWS